jgi:signal recognition particle subunit SRP14
VPPVIYLTLRSALKNIRILTFHVGQVSLKEYLKFQASYATVLKAHMHALKKRERKDRKKAGDAEKVPENVPKKQKKGSSKKSSGSKS